MPTNDPACALPAIGREGAWATCWLGAGVWDGWRAMAYDDALLDWAREQSLWPSLALARAYAWREPTLSLGTHQPVKDVSALRARFAQRLARGELQWTRRPTGGRAILHDGDASFSVISNAPACLRLSVADSYRVFCRIEAHALEALGVKAQTAEAIQTSQSAPTAPAGHRPSGAYMRSPACFETRTQTDLLDGSGRKISGSAQLRRAGGLLQQGTIFLPGGIPLDAFARAFSQAFEAAWPTAERIPEARITQCPRFQALWAARLDDYAAQSDRLLITDPGPGGPPAPAPRRDPI
ncbi:MAG: hypothetical protein IPK79_02980 [Vampirovibrionales bacterium]|nr:hypothetical protein [Vampirovibrionales bacterium]